MKKVLIACEESQAVCKEFRRLGFEAYSCDIQECSGGHPEWHIQGDALAVINGNCTFVTADAHTHTQSGRWDLIIAHPPCTYLTVTGNSWFNVERWGEKAIKRAEDREEAFLFFMEFAKADCDRIAIENPVGYPCTWYRHPDQVVHPYWFGDDARKKTCLWLKGLPKLKPTKMVEPTIVHTGHGTDSLWHMKWYTSKEERSRDRSKTFPGFAKAMADQWGKVLNGTSDELYQPSLF